MELSTEERNLNLICLTVDVEWAHPEILADIVQQLNERKLCATFFVTHAGVQIPGHERALHPNFRRGGDTLQKLQKEAGLALDERSDAEIYRYVVRTTHAFCPDAKGVRAHSLFYDSELLPIYREAGLEYDSSYYLPMVPCLKPVWKEFDLLEMPIYYMDHLDLRERTTGFSLEQLGLDQAGLKVFDFHPNIVYINAATEEQYLESKACYHEPEALLRQRGKGRGARTLFLEVLDFIADHQVTHCTLAELNRAWRKKEPAGEISMSGE